MAYRPPVVDSLLERLVRVERDCALTVKAAILPLLVYYLFFANWEEIGERGAMLETVRTFLIPYVLFNLSGAFLLSDSGRIHQGLVRMAGLSLALLDVIFVSALTLATGGYESLLYWAYILVIVRNALSLPNDVMQIALNGLSILCYILAGWINILIQVKDFPEAEQTIEPFFLKIMVLALVTACCYGVQVLFERQREAEEERREHAIRHHQLQMAGRLASEIAHQLKNPLGIINNAAYNLRRARQRGDEIEQQIDIIREEVSRSDRILTDLMDYAHLEEGRIESLDPIEELDRAIDRILPAGSGFQVKIERHYRPPLPRLFMQRGHLSEILVNILQNAREAMEGQGRITVRARFTAPYSVHIAIKDDGPGVPPEKRRKIFDPYFTTKETGTGLGLAIVKHTVELYGGSVAVMTDAGKGTRFDLELPARTDLRLIR